jgi:hypothetical protein
LPNLPPNLRRRAFEIYTWLCLFGGPARQPSAVWKLDPDLPEDAQRWIAALDVWMTSQFVLAGYRDSARRGLRLRVEILPGPGCEIAAHHSGITYELENCPEIPLPGCRRLPCCGCCYTPAASPPRSSQRQ